MRTWHSKKFVLLALFSTLSLAGCATYQVGSRSLYAPDISTVYVPMFESDSFRPGLGERLTEAVVKEIDLKTPFKVVRLNNADSILTGKIVQETKRVKVENFTDDTRELDIAFLVEVTWLNRRREPILQPGRVQVPAELLEIGQSAPLIPEAGQSLAVSQQQAINRLAEQIVATMEEPW